MRTTYKAFLKPDFEAYQAAPDKAQRLADKIGRISAAHYRASDPAVIAEKVAERRRLNTSPVPPNVDESVRQTLRENAYWLEVEMWKTEFPGHEPPPSPWER